MSRSRLVQEMSTVLEPKFFGLNAQLASGIAVVEARSSLTLSIDEAPDWRFGFIDIEAWRLPPASISMQLAWQHCNSDLDVVGGAIWLRSGPMSRVHGNNLALGTQLTGAPVLVVSRVSEAQDWTVVALIEKPAVVRIHRGYLLTGPSLPLANVGRAGDAGISERQ